MAHVLVVDDVDVVRIAVGMILEREGHTVEVATDGSEALSLVGVRPPDAVITDLWMPHSDGLSLIRMLKAKFPGVAIVAMSGGSRRYDQESSLDQARTAGACQLLMKPVGKQDLLDAVTKAIQIQRATATVPDTAS